MSCINSDETLFARLIGQNQNEVSAELAAPSQRKLLNNVVFTVYSKVDAIILNDSGDETGMKNYSIM